MAKRPRGQEAPRRCDRRVALKQVSAGRFFRAVFLKVSLAAAASGQVADMSHSPGRLSFRFGRPNKGHAGALD
jgi:hypothetical protein